MQWARYFDERVETMPSSWTRRLEDDRLAEEVARCYQETSFYHRRLDAERVRPEQVRRLDDLHRLPLTTRQDLAEAARQEPPFGGTLCADELDVVRVHLGEGGGPNAVAYTEQDVRRAAAIGARALWASGARPDDLVVHGARFGLSDDGLSAQAALEATGAAVAAVTFPEIPDLVARWEELRATALAATTTFALELAEAVTEHGREARRLGLGKLLVRLDPNHLAEPAKRLLEEVWGVRSSAYYGVAEIAPVVAAECEERDGLHFLGHGSIAAELVDPRTGKVQDVEPGARGELVLTHLDREATPLLRLRTGDLVSVAGTECECGRTGFRFRIVGRVGG